MFIGIFEQREDWPREPDDPAYERYTFCCVSMVHGTISNQDPITFFPRGSPREYLFTEVGLFDARVGGHLMYHGTLTTQAHLFPGDSCMFAAGSLSISWDAVPAEPLIRVTSWERILRDDA